MVCLSKNFFSTQPDHQLYRDQKAGAKGYHALPEIDFIDFQQGQKVRIWVSISRVYTRYFRLSTVGFMFDSISNHYFVLYLCPEVTICRVDT